MRVSFFNTFLKKLLSYILLRGWHCTLCETLKDDIPEYFCVCVTGTCRQFTSFFPYNNFHVGLKCWTLSTLKLGLSDLTADKNEWIRAQFVVILCLSVLLNTHWWGAFHGLQSRGFIVETSGGISSNCIGLRGKESFLPERE